MQEDQRNTKNQVEKRVTHNFYKREPSTLQDRIYGARRRITISPSEWAEKIASTENCSESSSRDEWDGGRIDLPPLAVERNGG